jgi:hypothetical protein
MLIFPILAFFHLSWKNSNTNVPWKMFSSFVLPGIPYLLSKPPFLLFAFLVLWLTLQFPRRCNILPAFFAVWSSEKIKRFGGIWYGKKRWISKQKFRLEHNVKLWKNKHIFTLRVGRNIKNDSTLNEIRGNQLNLCEIWGSHGMVWYGKLVSCWTYIFIPEEGSDVFPKRRLTLNGLHGVVSQKIVLFTWIYCVLLYCKTQIHIMNGANGNLEPGDK